MQTAADDLEGLNQRILDTVELKLAELFHMDILQDLGRIPLDDIAVLVEAEGGQQSGMILDRGLHCQRHLIHIDHILVELEHGEQVIHR